VPDVAFYWHMSAGQQNVARFHYADGRFVSSTAPPCTGANSSSPVCAGLNSTGMQVSTISPADYNLLRPRVETDLQKQSPAASRRLSFDDAHAVDLLYVNQLAATAVGLGPCSIHTNCSISIYGHDYHGGCWPLLLDASGWGVTRAEERSPFFRTAFVIARNLPGNQVEFTRYSAAGTGPSMEPPLSARLVPDACEIVSPKSGRWPAVWDASALTARPVSCFQQAAPAGKSETSTLEADITMVTQTVQDGTGTVWAVGAGPSQELYRWRDGGWTGVSGAGFTLNIWPGPDNGVLVLVLESSEDQQAVIEWRRGNEMKMVAMVPVFRQFGEPNRLDVQNAMSTRAGVVLIVGNGGVAYRQNVAVSGPAPGLFRLDAEGRPKRIYTFTADQYPPYRIPEGRLPYYLPLQTTHDGQGRVWISCGWSWLGGPRGAALEGFLVTDGATVQYHREIPGLSSQHLLTLDLWDHDHLVAALFNDALYTINTSTFQAERIPEPQSGAFRFVQKVFHSGNDRYVLTFGRLHWGVSNPAVSRFLTGALWRWHDGQWTELLHDIGDSTGAGVVTAEGFWLGVSDGGLQYVPTNGTARQIDWRQGLPLDRVNGLFRLPDGHIVATDNYGETRSVEFDPASLAAHSEPSVPLTVLRLDHRLQADRSDHLWSILPQGILGEWDGAHWAQHPFPSSVQPSGINGLDVDTSGRVWLFPGCRLGPMAFYDPHENRWSSYEDYGDALAGIGHPVEFLHPEDDFERPTYGPGGQIVFFGSCGGVNYFDGSDWRLWNSRQLPASRNIAIPPFFDKAGHLALNMRGGTWQWTQASGWVQIPPEPQESAIPFLLPNPFQSPAPPPPGCVTPPPSSLVRDALGRSWWVADDALYEGVAGKCRVILAGSTSQPFIDGRQLGRVLLDARGNVFLGTQNPLSYIVLPSSLEPGTPLPAAAEYRGGP